jgi:hypothetical protein
MGSNISDYLYNPVNYEKNKKAGTTNTPAPLKSTTQHINSITLTTKQIA